MLKTFLWTVFIVFISTICFAEVEIERKRGERHKVFLQDDGNLRFQAYTGDIHYKNDYDLPKQPWLDIDSTYYEEKDEYLEYNKLPFIVRVYKNKVGYQILERKTGAVHEVELVSIDSEGEILTKWKSDDVDMEMEIGTHAVRLWKHIKTEKAKELKWKVTRNPKGLMLFREKPEVVNAKTGEKVEDGIVVTKEIIDDKSFYWLETVKDIDLKVDVDFTSATGDGITRDYDNTWSAARNGGGFDYYTTDASLRQAMSSFYDETNVDWYIARSHFSFDTSSLPDSADVVIASLKLFTYDSFDSSVCAMKWTGGQTITADDFNDFTGSSYGYADWGSSEQYVTINFNSTGIADINKTGYTDIMTREYDHDYLNVSSGASDYYNGCYYANSADSSKWPTLVIVYSTGRVINIGGTIQ